MSSSVPDRGEVSTGPVVMVVEDNARMRSLICDLVEEVTPFVHQCSDGVGALELYSRVRPEWVLMDIELDGMDGLMTTAEIRRLDPDARVIIVSDHDDAGHRSAAAAAGACAYVQKESLLGIPALLTAASRPLTEPAE